MELTSHGVVAIVTLDGKYLLLKESRDLMNGKWAPPHGRCDSEDLTEEDAVIREVKEETNLNVTPVKKIITMPADTKVKTVAFWLVKLNEVLEIKLDQSESTEYCWVNIDEALELELYPGTKTFFENVKGGKLSLE